MAHDYEKKQEYISTLYNGTGKYRDTVDQIVFPVIATDDGDIDEDGVFIVKNEDAMFTIADSLNDRGNISVIVGGGNQADYDEDIVEFGDVTFEGKIIGDVTPMNAGIVAGARESFFRKFIGKVNHKVYFKAAEKAPVKARDFRRFADKVAFIRSSVVPDRFVPNTADPHWLSVKTGQLFVILDGSNREQVVDYVTSIFEKRGLNGISVVIADYDNMYGRELGAIVGNDIIHTVS